MDKVQQAKLPDGSVREVVGSDEENVYDIGDTVETPKGAGQVIAAGIDKETGGPKISGRYYWVMVDGKEERFAAADLPATAKVRLDDTVEVTITSGPDGKEHRKETRKKNFKSFPISVLEFINDDEQEA